MILGLHHVAILTYDIDNALTYYCDFFQCKTPQVVHVQDPEQNVNLKTAMLPIGPRGETALQIIQPIEGIGQAELIKGGEGTIFEIGYRVDNLEEFNEGMIAKGFRPANLAEKPIPEKYIVSKFGNRYSLLPKEATRGTRSEFVQIIPRESKIRSCDDPAAK